jgi:hypothetical protein
VLFGALHGELDSGAVRSPHGDRVTGSQLPQPVEDRGTGPGVDVTGDDGGSSLAGLGPAGPPAGLPGVPGYLEGA